MLAWLLAALVGETVFGAIMANHRTFQAEMERYLEEGSLIGLGKTPSPPAR